LISVILIFGSNLYESSQSWAWGSSPNTIQAVNPGPYPQRTIRFRIRTFLKLYIRTIVFQLIRAWSKQTELLNVKQLPLVARLPTAFVLYRMPVGIVG